MDASVAQRIEEFISQGTTIRNELHRLTANRRPSKTGVGILAKLLVPSGYKRLSGQVGNLWLDSSFTSQLHRLGEVEREWGQHVIDFLGTVSTLSTVGQRPWSSRQLQVKFSKTQGYSRPLSRLNGGLTLLQDLKLREVVNMTSTVEIRRGTERLERVDSVAQVWFDGDLDARKGDILRVIRGFPDGARWRATVLENLTAGYDQRSRVAGTSMTVSPVDLDPPLVGRVEGLERRDGNSYATLSTGVYESPNLFFPAGDFVAGQDALRRILRTDVRGYLKVADPYVSLATLSLLESVPIGTEVRLLCSKPDDVAGMKKKANELKSKGFAFEIRLGKRAEMHGRYLISDGAAWMIDHSLKDFGTKDCAAARLAPPVRDLEEMFDRRWTVARAA